MKSFLNACAARDTTLGAKEIWAIEMLGFSDYQFKVNRTNGKSMENLAQNQFEIFGNPIWKWLIYGEKINSGNKFDYMVDLREVQCHCSKSSSYDRNNISCFYEKYCF